MLWDNQNLYLLADIKDDHIWGNLKQKDTVIYYNNDFEIFIDPDGDTHNYMEIEINALNTVWDLFLDKPYRNKAIVDNDWDVKGLESAVFYNGTLNDSSDIDFGWILEIAMPWVDLKRGNLSGKIPVNSFWRMNFSRVNWDFDLNDKKYERKKDLNGEYIKEYNWVWSPQGIINMHEPEHWGYVYFADSKNKIKTIEPPNNALFIQDLYNVYLEQIFRKNPDLVSLNHDNKEYVFKKYNTHGMDFWEVKYYNDNRTYRIHFDGRLEVQ